MVGYFAYLAVLSLAANLSGQSWPAFFLAPLPMAFLKLDDFRFMLLALSGYLLFFEGTQPASNFLFFNTPDSMVIAYIGLYLFNRDRFATFSIPVSPGLVALYAFILYGFALSIIPLAEFGTDFYVMRDIKNLCFLLLVPMLCRAGNPLLEPKGIFLALCAVLALTSMHALVRLIGFLANGERVITWNEIFFADGVLIATVLLGLGLSRRTRIFLYVCLTLCLMGLLATQTRGLWISVLVSLSLYGFLRVRKSGRFSADLLLRHLPSILILLGAAEILLRVSTGKGLEGYLLNRLTAHQAGELVNPWSSLGYRIHESLAVWEKRTWFGHGSGARLYLFFTQLGMSKYINWWSIHSEYFEMLHKYGFVGLGIFLWFLGAVLKRARRLAMQGARFPSTIGFVALITLVNHCVVSITSGFLIRENVMLYMAMIVGMVEYYLPRTASVPAAMHPDPGGSESLRTA